MSKSLFSFVVVSVGLLVGPTLAQGVSLKTYLEEREWHCNWGGQAAYSIGAGVPSGSNVSAELINKYIDKILEKTGIAKNFVITPANVPNAMATMQYGKRIIAYNPHFFANLQNRTQIDWSVVSVLAHEVGHHLEGHVLSRINPAHQRELEADKFSGFILGRLGAFPNEALAAMSTLNNSASSSTHPGQQQRLDAILDGWIQWCESDHICKRFAIPSNRSGLLTLRRPLGTPGTFSEVVLNQPTASTAPASSGGADVGQSGSSTCREPSGVTCQVAQKSVGSSCRCTAAIFGGAEGQVVP